MKKVLLLVAVMLFALQSNSFASNYKLDDAKIDMMFSQSENIGLDIATFAPSSIASVKAEEVTAGGALLRATFCSWIALHRSYLGTGGKNLFWLYFCTGGGCGIVSTVDWWVLLFKTVGDGDVSKYRDNPKFIMWG